MTSILRDNSNSLLGSKRIALMITSAPPVYNNMMQEHRTAQDAKTLSKPFLEFKYKAITQTAESLAAQKGYNWESKRLWNMLQSQKEYMNKIYNFQKWMLDGGKVVPPVIIKANSAWTQKEDQAVQTNVEYKIIKPAKISPIAPNWRDYFPDPATEKSMDVNPIMLPKNELERAAWQIGIKKGWKEGIAQAHQVFKYDLRRMQEDYMGMLTFWALSRQRMVSAPILADGNVGIVVGANKLSIGQKVFRLTMPSSFRQPYSWTTKPSAPSFGSTYEDGTGSAAQPSYSHYRSGYPASWNK
jgi:defect-in-organelle-trafficking protein DotC